MMCFKRPAKPTDFDSAVKAAKLSIQKIIDAGEVPKSTDFDDQWGEFKPKFALAQHNKCGYCELEVIAGQPGDVEHFAPKSDIKEILVRGKERVNSASLTGGKEKTVSSRGYWWLAYDWTNYLLSCRVCNSPWKKNFFPVQEETPTYPPTKNQPNTALLLNPFGPLDPIDHLRFDTVGAIFPRNSSAYGKATIHVCGLDRKALTTRRQKLAARVHREAQRLVSVLNASPIERKEAWQLAEYLLDVGHEEQVFCGMVRSIVKDYLDVPWSSIELLVQQLADPA